MAFSKGFEKLAGGVKSWEAGVRAAIRRAGHDPKKFNLRGRYSLGGITEPKKSRLPKVEHADKWRVRALQELFPKGKKLSEKSVTRRLTAALYGSPFTGTQGRGMRLVRAVQNKIEKDYPHLSAESFDKKLGVD